MSLNPASLNNPFRFSTSAKAKGPGAPGGGSGIFSCFLTVAKANSDSGTFDGADHTAAESLPFVISIAHEVVELKAQVKVLISQIQMLRSDFRELKASS